MKTLDRRLFLAGAGALALCPGTAFAVQQPRLVMWKDPSCGCCGAWGERVEAAFRERLTVIASADMAAVKRARGIPQDLWSCHTAMIHGVIVEGHVPPADIQRLVSSRNRQIAGLAVPGMPAGAPGMDVAHSIREPYQVIAFGQGGRRSVFASHR